MQAAPRLVEMETVDPYYHLSVVGPDWRFLTWAADPHFPRGSSFGLNSIRREADAVK